jgi:hypothetical protein
MFRSLFTHSYIVLYNVKNISGLRFVYSDVERKARVSTNQTGGGGRLHSGGKGGICLRHLRCLPTRTELRKT